MTMKAKLEAVVYAAEEPVTLSLLATMFADEVLQNLAETSAAGSEPKDEQIELLVVDTPADAVAEQSAVPQETAATESDEKKMARQRDRQVRQVLQGVLQELMSDYASSDRGMEIREIAGGYRMATKPEYHDAVRGFVKSLKPPMKLSLQALETLAVIAYKQPITAPEVGDVRGVDSAGVLGSLVSRKLITTAGRKQVIGRPILYKTTKEFLLRFGLKDLNDLPSMEEFEKMAGELADTEGDGTAPLLEGIEGASAETSSVAVGTEPSVVSETEFSADAETEPPVVEAAEAAEAGETVEEAQTIPEAPESETSEANPRAGHEPNLSPAEGEP